MRKVFLPLFVLLLWPAQSHALSCAMPVFDDAAIDKAALIFEGTVTDEIAGFLPGGMLGNFKVKNYGFHIDRLWKGAVEGGEVKVGMDSSWGDGFAVGKQYLVVADKTASGYESFLCGNTTYLGEAGLAGQPEKLEILKRKFPGIIP
jgi:hypothetical protein